MIPLSMAKPGEALIIKRITGNDKTKRFLENLGFTEGCCITVINEISGNANLVNLQGLIIHEAPDDSGTVECFKLGKTAGVL